MLLGSDALGRLALGQISSTKADTLIAVTGSYVITGSAIAFRGTAAAASGTYAISGGSAPLAPALQAAPGAYAVSGVAAAFLDRFAAAPGAYSISGQAAPLVASIAAAGGSYAITLGQYELHRTGGEYDQVYGGIGHYLEELERARQLQKITRKTPAPIVQPPAPRLPPLAAPPVGLPNAGPDVPTVLAQRMAAQQAAQRQAQTVKRRRQDLEILLLAS